MRTAILATTTEAASFSCPQLASVLGYAHENSFGFEHLWGDSFILIKHIHF